MPYSSIRLSRAVASHVAGSTSRERGGCFGGYSFQPAWAAEAAGADTLVAEVPGVLLHGVVPLARGAPGRPTWRPRARRPQVVRFDDVGVGVDDPVAVDVGRQHGSSCGHGTGCHRRPHGGRARPIGYAPAHYRHRTIRAVRCQPFPYDDSSVFHQSVTRATAPSGHESTASRALVLQSGRHLPRRSPLGAYPSSSDVNSSGLTRNNGRDRCTGGHRQSRAFHTLQVCGFEVVTMTTSLRPRSSSAR